ncbi:DUF1761 domain-containing protein [Microbispora sp. NPDC049633]|uniref:DUF1761 domain-containing protein n=1 Tax=Microbispora sp. NPDC049633 TaxID=3154355 RepID=UPI0034418982
MPESTLLLVLIAAVVAFASGALYYVVLGGRLAATRAPSAAPAAASPVRTPLWTFAVETGRCLVLAGVVTGLAAQARIDTWIGGLVLGLVLWIGFPAVLWIGAIVHENTPWRVAAIHAGDWLVKLLVLGAIVGVRG